MKRGIIASSIIVLTLLLVGIATDAAEKQAKLLECVKGNHSYISMSIEQLQINGNIDTTFYQGREFVICGTLSDISGKRAIINSKGGTKCHIKADVSLSKYNDGDVYAVYGKMASNDKKSGYVFVADKLEKCQDSFPLFSCVSVINNKKDIYDVQQCSDLRNDSSIRFYLPKTFLSEYVSSQLTNNDVRGYQYSLNAIEPQNTDYAESFSIFYFLFDKYIEKPKAKYTGNEKKTIEREIIKNINPNADIKNMDIKEITTASGKKMNYYVGAWKTREEKDYRLEFFFYEDGAKGIVCMLYLYFPDESQAKHVNEVAALINSL